MSDELTHTHDDAQHEDDGELRGSLAHAAHTETLAPTTTILGRTIPLPLYTVVFGTLAVVTVVEVLIAEFLPREFFLTIPLLVVLSAAKAILVVLYYMHLKEDSRIFAAALILPVFVAFVSTLFLLAVPPQGY